MVVLEVVVLVDDVVIELVNNSIDIVVPIILVILIGVLELSKLVVEEVVVDFVVLVIEVCQLV